MSTERQKLANKLNAQKSTGPRTPAGKSRVSLNALKHGLTGKDLVLPDENAKKFDSFRSDLLASLVPEGELENMLADRIVSCAWRLRRIPRLEALIYRRMFEEKNLASAQQQVAQYAMTYDERTLSSMDRRTVETKDREAHDAAQKRAELARSKLDDPSLGVTRTFQQHGNYFSNLSRQEIALARMMERALHELQRLEASRAGEYVAPPEVVDVNLEVNDSNVDTPMPDGNRGQGQSED